MQETVLFDNKAIRFNSSKLHNISQQFQISQISDTEAVNKQLTQNNSCSVQSIDYNAKVLYTLSTELKPIVKLS